MVEKADRKTERGLEHGDESQVGVFDAGGEVLDPVKKNDLVIGFRLRQFDGRFHVPKLTATG